MQYNQSNQGRGYPNQSNKPPEKQVLTPWLVAQAIPGSIGSVDAIAKRLGFPRMEVRKFIEKNKELSDALDDELLAAKERMIEQTYQDGMDGSQQARQDFFKMVNGYFEKKDNAKETNDNTPKVAIIFNQPQQKFKMLNDDNDVIDIDDVANIN